MKRALHVALVVFAALIGAAVGAAGGLLIGWMLATGSFKSLDCAFVPVVALAIVGALLVGVVTAMGLRGASNAECGRLLREHLLRPILLLLFLAFAPGVVLSVLFPWRLAWGDCVLVDLGPMHDWIRFEYEFGDVTLRDGEQRQWRLPAVPGRGLELDVAPLRLAMAHMPGASVVLVVEDARGRQECVVPGGTEVMDGNVYEVLTVPRSEQPVTITLRVAASGGGAPAVAPLRAREYFRK